ncbi:MAG: hypothetical protein JXQ29_11140 [Planctomycetes bacterium]|nr:hypothetical protein [Planctomycetota bacterium]
MASGDRLDLLDRRNKPMKMGARTDAARNKVDLGYASFLTAGVIWVLLTVVETVSAGSSVLETSIRVVVSVPLLVLFFAAWIMCVVASVRNWRHVPLALLLLFMTVFPVLFTPTLILTDQPVAWTIYTAVLILIPLCWFVLARRRAARRLAGCGAAESCG